MLHTKFRESSGEEIFEGFLPYMGVAAILVTNPDAANKISFPLPKEVPHKIWLCSTAHIKAVGGSLWSISVNKLSPISKLLSLSGECENQ